MHRIIGFVLFLFMAGCSQTDKIPTDAGGVLSGNNAQNGPTVAAQLTTLYGRKFPNCNKIDSQPAFLCSGITLRVTVKDPAGRYKVWDPSPTSTRSGGISFSYLRADTNFGRLVWGYGNGYILYPFLEQPAGKDQLQYLCTYPMDAWGWHRSATEVCGPSASYPVQSKRCQDAGVTTAAQAVAVWNLSGGNPNLRQCGFDVQDDRNTLAGPAFYQSLLAKSMLGTTGFNEHNEIIIRTWPAGRANTFPIMAFFFIAGGSNEGLADAQYNQRDFYNSTNPKVFVPIIRLTPPVNATGTATFAYIAADQVVTQ
ncbi:MAG: halovibrin HvnC [Pseudomonas sp.]|uniref:halovibrin HvnC n=1 Tax=Pseudomonas sp. TaxID=306 RepID=UPI0027246A28|nr:halovibrin HvnC [Pseudomonas sp.]MDO8403455.1 halovibrin HvnC [Pseudomonas sp.]